MRKSSHRLIGTIVLASALLFATAARAVPTLQLDIIGGSHDAATQTVFSNGPAFSLVAYGTPGPKTAAHLLGQMFYISAAFVPSVDRDLSFNAGSFEIDGAASLQPTRICPMASPRTATARI